VLEIAHVYEQSTLWWRKNPPWFEDKVEILID
jgi:hypothetical protein